MPTWRVHTRTGSIYEIHEIGGEWRMTVPTAPSSGLTLDLRGSAIAIDTPIPWPPQIGRGMLILMQWATRHVKVRGTTAVVRVEALLDGEGD